MVGNKDDLLEKEEVTYEEGLELAKEINAIFQRTSTKIESGGIDILFNKISIKLIEPDSKIINDLTREKNIKRAILPEKSIKKEKIKKCC